MTWIPHRFRENTTVSEHESPGTELAPGVVIERRRLLWIPAVSAAALVLGQAGRLLANDPSSIDSEPEGAADPKSTPRAGEGSGTMTWNDFLEDCIPVAQGLRDSDDLIQDAYLYRIASFAARIDRVPGSKLGAFGGLDPKVEFGVSHRGRPFFVVEWRMEPGAILPAHCHPTGAVCTVGLEGEARLRNFEIEGNAPAYDSGSKETFRIRETHNEILTKGRINTLSISRDNIHYFQASRQGARGIDITSGFGGDGSFSFIAFEPDKPVEPERKIFEATWIGSKL